MLLCSQSPLPPPPGGRQHRELVLLPGWPWQTLGGFPWARGLLSPPASPSRLTAAPTSAPALGVSHLARSERPAALGLTVPGGGALKGAGGRPLGNAAQWPRSDPAPDTDSPPPPPQGLLAREPRPARVTAGGGGECSAWQCWVPPPKKPPAHLVPDQLPVGVGLANVQSLDSTIHLVQAGRGWAGQSRGCRGWAWAGPRSGVGG